MNPRTLLFRADASVSTGTGHVMRCLALAQAWQDHGGRALFAMADGTAAIRERLLAESCQVLEISAPAGSPDDAQQTSLLAREHSCNWIVVDGYGFGGEYQKALKSSGKEVLFFDDYGHANYYAADLVLNQNLCAEESLYRERSSETRLLLRPRYCILRREFQKWREWKREIHSHACRVLVTMGGSDPENVTRRVIEALSLLNIEDLETQIVVGGSNPYFAELEEEVVRCGRKIRLHRDISNIADLMAWADVAVSAAGSTCWELCLLGLPALLIDVADNQTQVAKELDRRECAIHLGNARWVTAKKIADELEQLLKSAEKRKQLSAHARELVDGRGASRVIAALRGHGVRLRPVATSDSRILWEWANDPQVRTMAFSTGNIPWQEHERWFASKMKNPACQMWMAEDDQGAAVGQFRVDWRSAQDGDIDVSVSRDFRGSGYGATLIERGVEAVFAGKAKARLHAFVKTANRASCAAFESAGFHNIGEEDVSGARAIHYIRER